VLPNDVSQCFGYRRARSETRSPSKEILENPLNPRCSGRTIFTDSSETLACFLAVGQICPIEPLGKDSLEDWKSEKTPRRLDQ
jgi:hypothetical protein